VVNDRPTFEAHSFLARNDELEFLRRADGAQMNNFVIILLPFLHPHATILCTIQRSLHPLLRLLYSY